MMKQILSIAIVLFFFLSSCQKDPFYLSSSVQREVENGINEGFDGVIVCVHKSEETKLYASGWKNRENAEPMDPHAFFKIASISKLYIAAAVTIMICDSSLALDDKLSELIPETEGVIEYANEISLKMLIQHRSGIPDFIYQPGIEESDPDESYMKTLELVYNQPAKFKPSKRYGYSNTNYLLLGEIMNRTLGYSHHSYIQNEILDPLGLSNTYHLYNESDSDRVVSGYYVGYGDDLKSTQHTRPGGSMVATASDVARFITALIKGEVFNEKEQDLYSQLYPYEHTGWIHGYTSIARYQPDIDAVIVQFVNTSKDELYWLRLQRFYNKIVSAVENEI